MADEKVRRQKGRTLIKIVFCLIFYVKGRWGNGSS